MPYRSLKTRIVFAFLIFLIALSGFAQMPIFKRYYIADIPGFAWLAQFYTTHFIHYLCAIILLGYGAYLTVQYFLSHRKKMKLTLSGRLGICSLAGLVLSGIVMVIRNLDGVMMNHQLIIGLDVFHIVMTMVLLAVMIFSWIRGKSWMMSR